MKVLLRVGQSPRGGAAPRKPVSEVPMERDQGAAHSLEPGKESVPVANSKIRTIWDTYGLGLMPNGSLGTGSGLLQIRSHQAWTEVAWEVAEAVQQELEVPSSRTGSSTSETGSGLAGTQVT
ncbi:ephrin B3 [Phyllostomus discolor]|nr:ephrin B3 [Phyllostomus discolor]